jgi:RNA methyltransferase, TrmH family
LTVGTVHIASRDNPLLVRLRRLAHDGGAYRKEGQVWLEGDHLCRALLARGGVPLQAVISASGWQQDDLHALAESAPRVAVVPDALFAALSALESHAHLGFLMALPATAGMAAALLPSCPTVVLDRLQDAGNVGSVLRSAAAFGFTQVLALKGTAALWSPKVLRAAMGAHFALHLVEGLSATDLHALELPLLATSSHHGLPLPTAQLPWPCAWLLGHEGHGVDPALLAQAQQQLQIPQPGGEESLNVGAAAAVCFYESARQRFHLAPPGGL